MGEQRQSDDHTGLDPILWTDQKTDALFLEFDRRRMLFTGTPTMMAT